MAYRKKKIDPIATIITVSLVALIGFTVYKGLIQPAIAKRRVGNNPIIDADINDTMDANFEVIDNEQTA